MPDDSTCAARTACTSAIASAERVREDAPQVQRVRSVLQTVSVQFNSRLRRLRQRRVPSSAANSALCEFDLQGHSHA